MVILEPRRELHGFAFLTCAAALKVGDRGNDLAAHHLDRHDCLDTDDPAEHRRDAEAREPPQLRDELGHLFAMLSHVESEWRRLLDRLVVAALPLAQPAEKVEDLIVQLRGLAGMGIQTVFGRVVGDYRLTPIEVMGREVIPAVADA